MLNVRSGWLHLLTGAATGRVLSLISNILLSRWLGPTGLGSFNLSTTTVQTADTLVRGGSDYAINFKLGSEASVIHTASGRLYANSFSIFVSSATLLCVAFLATYLFSSGTFFAQHLIPGNIFVLTILLILMVFFECISASGWELLLVTRQTKQVALRQGLFTPAKLFLAAIGALLFQVPGSMACWTIVSLIQLIWLKTVLRSLWSPFSPQKASVAAVASLLKLGSTFYLSNVVSSLLFFPMLLSIAAQNGLQDLGFLRTGQILQQLFALLPGTLVPVLFLKLRQLSSHDLRIKSTEQALRLIWSVMLLLFILYCLFDAQIIRSLFGSDYLESLFPTRILLLTSLCECLLQLVSQPTLASGHTRKYAIWQLGSSLLVALAALLLSGSITLDYYLTLRLIYVLLPLCGLGSSFLFNRSLYAHILLLIVNTTVVGFYFCRYEPYSTLNVTLMLSILSLISISISQAGAIRNQLRLLRF